MSKVTHLVKEFDGVKKLVGIQVETLKETFIIPVADATLSKERRRKVEEIEKACNVSKGSRYFKPSYSLAGYSYNISRKK